MVELIKKFGLKQLESRKNIKNEEIKRAAKTPKKKKLNARETQQVSERLCEITLSSSRALAKIKPNDNNYRFVTTHCTCITHISIHSLINRSHLNE